MLASTTLRHMLHALIMRIPSWNGSQSNSCLRRVRSKTGQKGSSRKPRNLMNDGVLALPVHDFPLTLVDVDPAVLFILKKLFPYFTDKALGMHGIPNVGKTPLGRIIAMAMPRYWTRKLNSKANLALGKLQSLISFGAKPVEKIGQICSMAPFPNSQCGNSKASAMWATLFLPKNGGELPNSRKAKWESTWSMISTFQQSLSMK